MNYLADSPVADWRTGGLADRDYLIFLGPPGVHYADNYTGLAGHASTEAVKLWFPAGLSGGGGGGELVNLQDGHRGF